MISVVRAALFLVVLLCAGLFAGQARAERCGDDARAWVARCAASSGVSLELESCPSSVAIVSSPDVRVEISTSEKAFQRVGGYGVSPIGDFGDWKLEPERRRKAFAAVVRCVEAEPPEALLSRDAPAPAVPQPKRAKAPWLFLAGLGFALAALVRRPRPAALALLVVASVFVIHRALVPFAFFHQNGQGPLWIDFAFRGDAGEYGPGYPELFGWASHVRRPDRGVAFLQQALAATVPLSTWALARASGATRRTAAILLAAAALDPVLVRIGASESYFSAMAALLFASAAILVTTDRLGLPRRALGLLGAALLVAEAARIHPLAWVPCALVPLALAARPGRARDRLARMGVAIAVVGAICTPLVLPSLRHAVGSGLGGEFLPGVRTLLAKRGAWVAAMLLPFVALAALPRTRRLGSRALVLALVVGVGALSDILAADAPVVRAAHLHLFAPAGLAAIAWARARWDFALFGALAAAHLASERSLLVLPTDAREQSWALEWRERLPALGEVASLERAGKRLLPLPLLGEGLPRFRPFDEEAKPRFEQGPRFYYRSSLCFTPEGAPACRAFEAKHVLRLLESRRLPSIASLPWTPLPPGDLEVALFALDEE